MAEPVAPPEILAFGEPLALAVEARDPTGAGDCFDGALVTRGGR